jgi:hypothetical protein
VSSSGQVAWLDNIGGSGDSVPGRHTLPNVLSGSEPGRVMEAGERDILRCGGQNRRNDRCWAGRNLDGEWGGREEWGVSTRRGVVGCLVVFIDEFRSHGR